MNSYEAVIQRTLEIEDLLTTKYNAYGKTFGDKIFSARHKLPSSTLPKLHTLLKERNRLVHQKKYKFNKRLFNSLAAETIRELKGEKEFRFNKRAVIGFGVAATAIGLAIRKFVRR